MEKKSAESSAKVDEIKLYEALKLSEERFRSMIDHTTDAIFCYEYDPPIPTDLPVEKQVTLFYQGTLVECNDNAAKSYGGQCGADVVGKKLTDLFDTNPNDLDGFFSFFIQSGYRVENLEAVKTHDDGTKRHFSNNGHGEIKGGKLVRVWGTFQDITSRKQAEKLVHIQRDLGLALMATRELDEILNLCLEKALLLTDMDAGGIYMMNDETGGMDLVHHTGLPEEFVKSSLHYDADTPNVGLVKQGNPIYTRHQELGIDLDGPRSREGLRAIGIIPIKNQGEVIACLNVASHEFDEVPELSRTGLETIASQIGSAIARGKVEHELDHHRENLEKLIEERTVELSGSEARFRAVFEHSPLGIVVAGQKSEIIEVNAACCDMLDYTPDELIGISMVELTFPDDVQKVAELIHRAVNDGAPISSLEIRLLNKSGQAVWCNLSGSLVFDEKGIPMYGLSVLEDISERKHNQEALEILTADLSRSNEELEGFAYTVSHDLQEPLRKIQAFGSRLGDKYKDALDDRGQDYLARMQDAAQRGGQMINDLLELSRVTTQGKPFRSTDLNQVLQDVISDLELRIERTKGSVEVEELPVIDADQTQMRQLFQNLVSNALKFHKPDTPPKVKVNADGGGHGRVQIQVQDNGIGFDEEHSESIFKPFERLHGLGEYEGSGIGLSVCRKIVDRHVGTIHARSQPGEGANFVITLPKQQISSETSELSDRNNSGGITNE